MSSTLKPNVWIPITAVDATSGVTLWAPPADKEFKLLAYQLASEAGGDIVLSLDAQPGSKYDRTLLVVPTGDAGVPTSGTLGGQGIGSMWRGSTLVATYAGDVSGWLAGVIERKDAPAPEPTVASATVGTGLEAGGTATVLTGTNFTAADSVYFGDASNPSTWVVARSVHVSATTKNVTTPPGTGEVDIIVRNGDGLYGSLTDGFEYT